MAGHHVSTDHVVMRTARGIRTLLAQDTEVIAQVRIRCLRAAIDRKTVCRCACHEVANRTPLRAGFVGPVEAISRTGAAQDRRSKFHDAVTVMIRLPEC
jgi:hypothetical protein